MGLDHHIIDDKNENEDNKTFRKFISPAIYIEKSISNTSISQSLSKEELLEIQNLRTKRCTCATDQKTCPYHWNQCQKLISTKELIKSATKTQETKTKFSPISLESSQDQSIKNWISKKSEERKKIELMKKMQEEIKLKERNDLLEKERQNFKKWLDNKKKLELKTNKQKEKELEEQQLKELEKEKKNLENEINFRLWVKRKEEEDLEKKIRKQALLINQIERKQRQAKENKKAFEKWLKTSTTKQKPISPNKGIECTYLF